MAGVPSLLSLCTDAITADLISGDHDLEALYELPSDLFEHLIMHLPPLSLLNLQKGVSMNRSDEAYEKNCNKLKRKRSSDGDFDKAWQILFVSRWPEGAAQLFLRYAGANELDFRCKIDSVHGVDWRQKYWEHHIQDCLDEAVETAFRPSFSVPIIEIQISDKILKHLVFGRWMDRVQSVSKLADHCQLFGSYSRWLRLHNFLCKPEMSALLKDGNLEGLEFRNLKSKAHVDGVRMFSDHNKGTLRSLEFIHCHLPSSFIYELHDSLSINNTCMHNIQYFSIKYSVIYECEMDVVRSGFLSFLSAARTLRMLDFCGSNLGADFGRMIFDVLLGYLRDLVTLGLSETNIDGCLSVDRYRTNSCFLSSFNKSVYSIRCLNLRGNFFNSQDIKYLKCVLALLPMLRRLDLSDNPVGDDGIRFLASYFTEASGRSLVELILENCELTCVGVNALLSILDGISYPLRNLSVADNALGCDAVKPIAKFWRASPLKVLDIGEIQLGPSGFIELEKEMPKEVKLGYINISKNRGGSKTAKFVSSLILRATESISVDASFNFIPGESLGAIADAMRLSKGTLKRLDLTGNCLPIHTSVFEEFRIGGKPVVILPSPTQIATVYDDEP